MEEISNTYYLPLVYLSVTISIIASFAALELGNRINTTKGISRYLWLFTGAFVLGMGMWTVHFIAMLSFHLSIPVTYNLILVSLSIFPAILASGFAFYLIIKPTKEKKHYLLSVLLFTVGIISMHFIGMEAMEMEATIEYNPTLWALSVVVAFITSLLVFYFIRQNPYSKRNVLGKIGRASIMGIAISGTHYLAMAAANFKPHHHSNYSGTLIDSINLAYSIGIGLLGIIGLVFISIFVDKQFEYQSLKLERKFRSVFESANDAIILADSTGTIVSWNYGAMCIFGYQEKEVLGKKIQIIIPEQFRAAHQKGLDRFLATGKPNVIGKTVELSGLRKNGDELPIELSIATWQEEGNIYFSSIIRDITERKQAEKKINEMVYRDPLTGLPNRLLLNDRLAQALEQANEHNTHLGVMFIDLDRFKYINDTLGHGIGDELLKEVAKRLQSFTSKTDTVSRQGGDEFIVLLSPTTLVDATKIAQKIVEQFRESLIVHEHELYITPSIGIALYPTDGQDIETLIKNADTAMYRVKEQGKNGFQFYTCDMNETVSKKLKLEVGLRKALERNELKIVYQPQIDVTTREIIGVEALIRWQHPEWGMISPAEFIPLAEETGLINPIGEWILYEACLQNKAWQNEGRPPIKMAVNISSRQFQRCDFINTVKKVIEETHINPNDLEFELTESIIQDSKHAISTMHELKNMGIQLSIDDFGTGYSSLSYLKTFPIDTLKIDQAFTKNIFTDSKDASLVHTIINMAHNLNLRVIAEGVETQEQFQFLQKRNCNEAQGYYFSRPVSAGEIAQILKEQKH